MNSKKSTILFITSPEAGQANCNLAVISALKARYGAEADIHLASYVDLRKRIPPDVRFHEIRGVSMTRGLMRRNGNDQEKMFEFIKTRVGFLGSLQLARRTITLFHPESPEDYVESANDVERIITEVDPDYIVVDSLMDCARDAIRKLGKHASLLTPNTVKEASLLEQGLKMFTIPALGSGYPYPLPWYFYPANIVIMLSTVIWISILDKRFRELARA